MDDGSEVPSAPAPLPQADHVTPPRDPITCPDVMGPEVDFDKETEGSELCDIT